MKSEFGTVKTWKRAIFVWDDSPLGRELVVNFGNERTDFLTFLTQFPSGKQCDGYGFDNDFGTFFACYAEYHYDPAIAVIKTDSEASAESDFVENFRYSSRMTEAEATERERESLPVAYSENDSIPYDPEILKIRKVKLLRVDFA